MKVYSINNVYAVSNNRNAKCANKRGSSEVSFAGNLQDFGRKVLRAENGELQALAIRYRKLPKETLNGLLKVRNSWGFVKTEASMEASARFGAALAIVENAISELKKAGTAEAKKRLQEIEDLGERGLAEAYNPNSYDSQIDQDIRDTLSHMV